MDGLIKQWFYRLNAGTNTTYYNYSVQFTDYPTVFGTISILSTGTRQTNSANIVTSTTNYKTQVGVLNGGAYQNVIAFGY